MTTYIHTKEKSVELIENSFIKLGHLIVIDKSKITKNTYAISPCLGQLFLDTMVKFQERQKLN